MCCSIVKFIGFVALVGQDFGNDNCSVCP